MHHGGTAHSHSHSHSHGHRHSHDEADPARLLTQEFWDERYSDGPIWSGQPNPLLVRYVTGLTPGRALDVGSGEGADVLWLAGQGWTVTGADISAVALARAARQAEQAGPEVAARVTWQQADILDWSPPERHFDLVSAQFMHLPQPQRDALHRRLAAAVAPGGTLLIVAHHPADLATVPRPFPAERFATGEQMATVLDPAAWEIETAAPERPGTGPEGNPVTLRDAVLRAVRRPAG